MYVIVICHTDMSCRYVSDGCHTDMSCRYVSDGCHTDISWCVLQMKSRLQRWGNKRAILACARPLHHWVRQGDVTVRLQCVRNLGLDAETDLPADETLTVKELVTMCHVGVVEFLVDFACGKVLPGEVNKNDKIILQRQRPYSEGAGRDTNAFKNVPPPFFAITLAALYPYLVEEQSMWSKRTKQSFAYPCTGLWPVKVVKRYVHFINVTFGQLEDMFNSYEKFGGEYHTLDDNGPQSESEDGDADAAADAAAEEEQESSDCDDVF